VLGEVNLAHTASAEQPLDDVAGEDLTVMKRHVRSLQTGMGRLRLCCQGLDVTCAFHNRPTFPEATGSTVSHRKQNSWT
jgi:hypothetical protein